MPDPSPLKPPKRARSDDENKPCYEDALSALKNVLSARELVLSDREKDLDVREEEMKKDREQLDTDMYAAYGNTGPTDVLRLNVGGTQVSVLRRTLTSVPDSMLASKFSGRWDDSIEKDFEGRFFIDQEYSLFRHILKYLRNKANGSTTHPVRYPRSPILPQEMYHEKEDGMVSVYGNFYRMVEYYGLTDEFYPVTLKRLKPKGVLEDIFGIKVDSKCWENYRVTGNGHKRHIKSFEVTLGTVQGLQIGWKLEYSDESLQGNETLLVGNKMHTYALDITKALFLVEGEIQNIGEQLEYSEGTVVRSQEYGRLWLVNGKQVAPIATGFFDRMTNPFHRTDYQIDAFTPMISVNGQVEISKIEYNNYNPYYSDQSY